MVNLNLSIRYITPAHPPAPYTINIYNIYSLHYDFDNNKFLICDGNLYQYIESWYMLSHMFIPLNTFNNWYEFKRWFENEYNLIIN